ncbi:hypothetical protein VTO42DRAFT_5323 [Malbranchea cinnamomea]
MITSNLHFLVVGHEGNKKKKENNFQLPMSSLPQRKLPGGHQNQKQLQGLVPGSPLSRKHRTSLAATTGIKISGSRLVFWPEGSEEIIISLTSVADRFLGGYLCCLLCSGVGAWLLHPCHRSFCISD